jgi:hypothetical protein
MVQETKLGGWQMTDQEKATNDVLEGIELEIIKLLNRKIVTEASDCCFREREKGFQEGLQFCRASLRTRYVEEDTE